MKPMLLTVIASPEVEEVVIDWLLAREELTGFTGQAAFGHSREHEAFSLVEQVTGRQKRAVFHLQVDEARARALIEAMRGDLAGMGLRYWLVPMADAGVID